MISSKFQCTQCKFETPKWAGKCPECQSWNTFLSKEEIKESISSLSIITASSKLNFEACISRASGVLEFDRVFTNGIQSGSVTLISGEPGVGKSTMLAQVLGGLAGKRPEEDYVYISGEENLNQMAQRFHRLNVTQSNVSLLASNDLEQIKEFIKTTRPSLVILDSVQVLRSTQANYSPGSVSLVKLVTEEIVELAKTLEVSFILIGQKTKDGTLAGPKHLEHMVDTVLSFENSFTEKDLKILKVSKNRFGDTSEIGLLKMKNGSFDINAYKSKTLEDGDVVGKSLVVIESKSRATVVEIEALVVDSFQGAPKRICVGYDTARLSMLVAVAEKYQDRNFQDKDIYIKVNGGTKENFEKLDLGILAALFSSHQNVPINQKRSYQGRISLTGDIYGKISSNFKQQITDMGITEAKSYSKVSNIEI